MLFRDTKNGDQDIKHKLRAHLIVILKNIFNIYNI